jgi:hypothetical protein
MDPRKYVRYNPIIPLLMVAVFLLIVYYMLSDRIYSLSIQGSFESWIPLGYWVALIGAIMCWATTIYWRPNSRWNYISLFLVLLALFTGIEGMEAYARLNDTYGYLWQVQFIGLPINPQVTPDAGYVQSWPAYFYFIATFQSSTGLSYYATAKILTVAIQFITVAVAIALGNKLFQRRPGAILFASVVVSILPWVVDHLAPEAFGTVFLLLMLYGIIGRQNSASLAIVVIGFVVATLTHGLTSYAIMATLGFVMLLRMIPTEVSSTRTPLKVNPRRMLRVALYDDSYFRFASQVFLFLIIIFASWAVTSVFVSENLNTLVAQILALGTTPATYQFGYLTSFRLPSVLTASIYAVLLVSLGLTLTIVSVLRHVKLEFLPLVLAGLLSVLLYFFPFVYADLADRILESTFPLLAWFVASGITKLAHLGRMRLVGIGFIMLLMITGFGFLYSHEAIVVYPSTEISGDIFYTGHSLPTSFLGFFSASPAPWELADAHNQTLQYFRLSYASQNISQALVQSKEIIYSTSVKNSMLYYTGKDSVFSYVVSSSMNEVYANPAYSIYSR